MLYLWSPYVIGQTIYIFIMFLSSFFPRLISAVGDWMSTILPHMVWPVRLLDTKCQVLTSNRLKACER